MSYCDCDGDPARVYRSNTVKARKRHRCDECAAAIEPGDSYQYAFGVWDGAAEFHTCDKCVAVLCAVQKSVPCFCYQHGEMHNDAIGCAEEFKNEDADLPPLVAQLIADAKAQPKWRANAA